MPVSTDDIAHGITNATLNGPSHKKKPYLLFSAAAVEGHTTPMLKLARELTQRGFEITFIGGDEFQDAIVRAGARPVSIPSCWSLVDTAVRDAAPAGLPRLVYDMKVIFVGATAPRWEVMKDTLEMLRDEDPERNVVVVTEPLYMGANPMLLGAPLPRGYAARPKVVSFCQAPYFASSVVTGPFGLGLPPDGSESGKARNQIIDGMMNGGPFAEPIEMQKQILRDLGADEKLLPDSMMTSWYSLHDVTLQMCPPSLEYVRPDMPPTVKFAGCLPHNNVPAGFAYPAWWDEVTRGDRRVVVVTQGTVATTLTDLLIPTINALAGREDLLVVAILGKKGKTLDADVAVPGNARVIDYLPYDAVLPHASAFVMNAGYGGFLHGVAHAVPMVLGGESEDKPEVAMRGEYAGVAVNLRTGQPGEGAVREAVDRVLTDPGFKKRAMAIKTESDALDAVGVVERQIMEYA